jgi:hypothetical protein
MLIKSNRVRKRAGARLEFLLDDAPRDVASVSFLDPLEEIKLLRKAGYSKAERQHIFETLHKQIMLDPISSHELDLPKPVYVNIPYLLTYKTEDG